MEISDLGQRLEALEEALVGAATGDYFAIEAVHDDPLAAIEIGVSVLVDDLRGRIAEIEQTNRKLDRRVTERTKELQTKLDEITSHKDLIEHQRETIQELSTPVLQLWTNVIAMPIVGALDARRSTEITERLLEAVERGNAHFAILDITGAEVADTSIAAHLLQMIRATALLGGQCVLTGVQPMVAQTLVSLGVSLDDVLIHRDLQAALSSCLSAMAGSART